MARTSSRNRIDQPRSRSRSMRPQYDPEFFGRWSERVARFIGSARFIGWMTAFVVIWLVWNTTVSEELRFDPFPFIFLTLMLSLQASYAAPLILLAQNRQDDRDRVQYLEDRNLTERLVADTEYLTREIASVRIATGDLATRDFLRGEVRDLAEELTTLLSAEQQYPPAPAQTAHPPRREHRPGPGGGLETGGGPAAANQPGPGDQPGPTDEPGRTDEPGPATGPGSAPEPGPTRGPAGGTRPPPDRTNRDQDGL